MSQKSINKNNLEFESIIRSAAAGFLIALVGFVSYAGGKKLYVSYYHEDLLLAFILVEFSIFIALAYAINRGVIRKARYLGSSWRFDLLAGLMLGGAGAWGFIGLSSVQSVVSVISDSIVAIFLCIAVVALGAALSRSFAVKFPADLAGLSFLSDGEINDPKDDLLNVSDKSRYFAEKVATEGRRGSIVFGVDGPWGVGKSSFINLAQRVWDEDESLIVFRFEPLKFSGEKDLVRAFVRELSGKIRSEFFVPELRPLASRYSRMIRAEPSVSFAGLRISMNEDGSTIDEIINDIDEALERIGRRVIVVIDDLDRVESEMVNRVLFMVRRSIMARNIAYVLIYDADRIISSLSDESTQEYFEKFINASMSLFIDLNDLALYLSGRWKESLPSAFSMQSALVLGLQSILTEVAGLLSSSQGGNYIRLLGDIRKIKRLINALLLMEMGQFELNQTDFDRRDLVHLLLLYINYPGTFRDIFAGEGENRSGIFAVRPTSAPGSTYGYENDPELELYMHSADPAQKYLITELFEAKARQIFGQRPSKEQLNTLACFNSQSRRNLSAYLRLIVRSVVPNPLETEALYEGLLRDVRSSNRISSALSGSLLSNAPEAQSKFWGLLAANAHSFSREVLSEAIATIIEFLPAYSTSRVGGISSRSSAVYSLAIIVNSLLDEGNESSSADARLLEIRDLILGSTQNRGLLAILGSSERGASGQYDMLLLRLLCCADRGNQLRNIHNALILGYSKGRSSIGGNQAVVDALRRPSQIAFEIFKATYIIPGLNFMILADSDMSTDPNTGEVTVSDMAGRMFTIYQLANSLPPTGSGVGCGYFDESGVEDSRGIARAMNEYVLGVCFAPTNRANMIAFADYCLSNFSRDYFDDAGAAPSRQSLEQGLDSQMFRAFWKAHGDEYKAAKLEMLQRKVVTANYSATFASLVQVWDALDGRGPDDDAEPDDAEPDSDPTDR